MLKHASPLRSSSRSSNASTNISRESPNTTETNSAKSESPKPPSTSSSEDQTQSMSLSSDQSNIKDEIAEEKIYTEKEVDCEGIKPPPPRKHLPAQETSSWASKLRAIGGTGKGIGPVITQGRAIVRRGLSFNLKKDSDTASIRSVQSECTNCENASTNPPTKKSTSLGGLQTEENSCFEYDLQGMRMRVGIAKEDHPSLKNLLKLPGVYAHVQIPEDSSTKSPPLLCPDTMSLTSADSFISTTSGRTSSRSWASNMSSQSNTTSDSSNSSSSEPSSATIKIFAKCLRSDIEYKTLSVNPRTTCKELVGLLLSKYRMKHRDPNLFYLTMEVTIRRWSGVPVRSLLVLEETARPAQLALCRPPGDSRFALQKRRGGIIKVHDTVLFPGSQYKTLQVSYRTIAEEAVQLLLNCYNRKENRHYYALHQVCKSPQYRDRRLQSDERPLELKAQWPRNRQAEFVFVLRRNMTQAFSLRKLSMRTSGDIKRSVDDNHIRNTKETKGTNLNRSFSFSSRIEPETALIDCTDVTPLLTKFNSKSINIENDIKTSTSEELNNLERNINTAIDYISKNLYGNKTEKTVSFVDNTKETKNISEKNLIEDTNNLNNINNYNQTLKKTITQPVSILKPPKPYPKHEVKELMPSKFEVMSKLPPVMESIIFTDNSAQTDITYNKTITMNSTTNHIMSHTNGGNTNNVYYNHKYNEHFRETNNNTPISKDITNLNVNNEDCTKSCRSQYLNSDYSKSAGIDAQNCTCKHCFYI